jgi:hypothetical protein
MESTKPLSSMLPPSKDPQGRRGQPQREEQQDISSHHEVIAVAPQRDDEPHQADAGYQQPPGQLVAEEDEELMLSLDIVGRSIVRSQRGISVNGCSLNALVRPLGRGRMQLTDGLTERLRETLLQRRQRETQRDADNNPQDGSDDRVEEAQERGRVDLQRILNRALDIVGNVERAE